MGTHRRLAMEVVDDVKLGKLVKQAGFRSGVATAGRAVSVHWHAGLGNIILRHNKKFLCDDRISLVGGLPDKSLGLLLMFLLPWLALPFVHGWARAFAAVAIVLPILAQAGAAMEFDESPFVCGDAAAGGVDFCVDDGAVDFCDFVAGRNNLARDFLSDRGVEARGGVSYRNDPAQRA